ncbi:MAG: hypothetical protein L3K17_05660 [Thermoplasmata archaeon]|nr:hypothetical protein [Thermoplasmata archaeon]
MYAAPSGDLHIMLKVRSSTHAPVEVTPEGAEIGGTDVTLMTTGCASMASAKGNARLNSDTLGMGRNWS